MYKRQALAWNDETAQDTYDNGAENDDKVVYTKHTMDGKIVLAGVAEANSPVQSVVSATTTNRETNTEVAFDWNLGRNEENLDGGFGAYETGKIAGVVFQDKNVDGFYSDKDINDRLTGDKPVAGETLQVAQWFFVPNGDTLPYEVDLGKEVELADGSKVTKTSDTSCV